MLKNPPIVRNESTVKVVTFTGEAQRADFGGVVNQITWRNAAVYEGLRTMFGCREDEEIVAVEINDVGIKAKFERR